MLFHQLHMLGGLIARAAVGSVALNDGAVHGVDDRLHERRAQEVLVAVLAAMDLNSHLAGQFYAQLAVHFQHSLRGDFLGEINSRFCHEKGPPFDKEYQFCNGAPSRGAFGLRLRFIVGASIARPCNLA